MGKKDFIAIHTYVSEEARHNYLTPLEKRDPPQERMTEEQWAEFAGSGEYAKCLQTWCGEDDFFFCHWIAETEQQIHDQLEAFGLDDLLTTAIYETPQFVTAFRKSEEIYWRFPYEDGVWR